MFTIKKNLKNCLVILLCMLRYFVDPRFVLGRDMRFQNHIYYNTLQSRISFRPEHSGNPRFMLIELFG